MQKQNIEEMTPEEITITTGIPPRKTNFEAWRDKLTVEDAATLLADTKCGKSCHAFKYCRIDADSDKICKDIIRAWLNMEVKR